jgi:signal-transduction protein with cAMP-binding, CBS, and nucleotidyltransferase domain
MGRVADILVRKGSGVHSIDKRATVFEAVKKMVEANVGSLLVTDGDAIHGIITERDYLRRIVLEGRTSKTTAILEVATERLIVVEPNRPLDECMAMMTAERIRHLPVVDEGKVVGVISIGDIVKHLSAEREAEVRYLTDYISGKYPG